MSTLTYYKVNVVSSSDHSLFQRQQKDEVAKKKWWKTGYLGSLCGRTYTLYTPSGPVRLANFISFIFHFGTQWKPNRAMGCMAMDGQMDGTWNGCAWKEWFNCSKPPMPQRSPICKHIYAWHEYKYKSGVPFANGGLLSHIGHGMMPARPSLSTKNLL